MAIKKQAISWRAIVMKLKLKNKIRKCLECLEAEIPHTVYPMSVFSDIRNITCDFHRITITRNCCKTVLRFRYSGSDVVLRKTENSNTANRFYAVLLTKLVSVAIAIGDTGKSCKWIRFSSSNRKRVKIVLFQK